MPDDVNVRCASDDDCPSGYACKVSLGRCVEPGADDVPPAVIDTSITLSADAAGPGQTLTLSFSTSEVLASDPLVRFATANQDAFTRTSAAETSYVYTYTTTGLEGSGVWGIFVDLIDLAGNETNKQGLGTIRFDFDPPAVTSATAQLVPAAGNPLSAPTALTDGSRYELVLATSEPVLTPLVRMRCGEESADLTLAGAPSASIFELDLSLDAALTFPDGACSVEVELEDLAGNVTTWTEVDSVSIDRARPVGAQAVHTSHLLHARFPWGAEQTSGTALQYLASATLQTAGDIDGTLIASAAFAAPNEELVQVRAYNAAVGGDFLGTSEKSGDGWTPIRLGLVDSAELWVSVVDAAGNESVAVRVPEVLWVATLGRKRARSFVENPHSFDVRSRLTAPSSAADAIEVGESDGIAAEDGAVATARGAATWRDLRANKTPYRRSATAFFHDAWKQQTIMFGGYMVYCAGPGSGNHCIDTWAWDGHLWREITPTDPNGDGNPTGGHSMRAAYDRVRGRALLLGANAGTWAWDGGGWLNVALKDPEDDGNPDTTWRPHVAYHELRDEIIVYDIACSGGCVARTWRYRPATESFERLAIASPDPREDAGITYDAYNGRILLFGGNRRSDYQDTAELWAYDGGDWQLLQDGSEAGAPPAAYGPTLVYDKKREVVLAYYEDEVPCGADWCTAMAELDVHTDTWSIPAVFDPEGDGTPDTRNYPSLTYDEFNEEILLYSGQNWNESSIDCPDGYCGNLWAWTGASWVRRAYAQQPTVVHPGPRSYHAGAWDPSRGHFVVTGGYDDYTSICAEATTTSDICPYTWRFQDGVWFLHKAGTQPVARYNAAMSYAPWNDNGTLKHGVLLHGGSTGADRSDTMFFDGTSWTTLSPATVPTASSLRQMAYDSLRDQVVMFGGWTDTTTWIWNGSNWRSTCTGGCTRPPLTYYTSLAYDAHRDRVVLFGGYTSGCSDQVWEFNPATETWSDVTPAEGPLGRQGASLVYVESRKKVAMYGGNLCNLWSSPCGEDTDTPHCNDLWEWDGEVWERTELRGVYGDARISRLSHSAASHAPGKHDILLFGGDELPGDRWDYQYRGDVWEIDMGALARPAHVAQFIVDATNGATASGTEVLGLDLFWRAAGAGDEGGTPVTGAELYVWNGAWLPVDSNSAASVSALDATLAYSLPEPSRLSSLLFGENRRFTAAVASKGPNGTTWARVDSDYLELRLRYRR